MSVPWTPAELYMNIVRSPHLVVAIASGVVRFDDTVERHLKAFRADLALGTAERGQFDPNDGIYREFFQHVRERSMWGPSVLLPEDGYYLFQNGFFETFHPALAEDTDATALGVKMAATAGLGLVTAALTDGASAITAARNLWEGSGSGIADHFILHMKQKQAGAAK